MNRTKRGIRRRAIRGGSILAALFAACSARYVTPPLPPDHPARPEIAESPVPAPSTALAGEGLPPPAASADGHAHHHAPAAEDQPKPPGKAAVSMEHGDMKRMEGMHHHPTNGGSR